MKRLLLLAGLFFVGKRFLSAIPGKASGGALIKGHYVPTQVLGALTPLSQGQAERGSGGLPGYSQSSLPPEGSKNFDIPALKLAELILKENDSFLEAPRGQGGGSSLEEEPEDDISRLLDSIVSSKKVVRQDSSGPESDLLGLMDEATGSANVNKDDELVKRLLIVEDETNRLLNEFKEGKKIAKPGDENLLTPRSKSNLDYLEGDLVKLGNQVNSLRSRSDRVGVDTYSVDAAERTLRRRKGGGEVFGISVSGLAHEYIPDAKTSYVKQQVGLPSRGWVPKSSGQSSRELKKRVRSSSGRH